ncbi:DUF551 domain-containing protein [Salmonella enterica subsp. enterica serovar Newport]|nr:DUF551 domain-containing protein [Salmonella enterica subsp. enterica serovar Newport]
MKELEFAITQSAFTSIRDGLNEELELARIALAALTAEPVLYAAEETLAYANMGEIHLTCLSEPMGDAVIPLYTDSPVPVVPEEMNFSTACNFVQINGMAKDDRVTLAMRAWNACRAAMLQGVEPVSNRDELPLDYLQGHKDGLEWAAQLAEANHPQTGDWLYDDPIELARAIRKGPDMPTVQAGNSTATPDGWISCSERMPDKGQRVLVCVDFDSSTVTPLVKDAEYTGSTFRIGHNTINTTGETSVTHWMPLPAPPQQ